MRKRSASGEEKRSASVLHGGVDHLFGTVSGEYNAEKSLFSFLQCSNKTNTLSFTIGIIQYDAVR